MKLRMLGIKSAAQALLGALLVFYIDVALSQTPFYQGKTITLIVGSGPGGMGDFRARALASVLVKHIPGNPTIVFQYMPGGGGRKATNHVYNIARPDGLTLLRVASSIVPYAVLGEQGVQYDIDKLIYLGTTEHFLTTCFTPAERLVYKIEKSCAPSRVCASAAVPSVTQVTYKAGSWPTCSI